MKKGLLLVCCALLALACSEGNKKTDPLAEITSEEEKETKSLLAAETTPNPNIPSYNYEALSSEFFEQQDNQTYVVNFWATWCKPCIKELPAFEQLNSNYKEQAVKVVLVSLDFPEKWESSVVPFIEKRNLKSQVVLLDDPDANTWIPAVSETWSGAIPATLIVKNGNRRFYERSFTYEELETELKTIL